MNGEESFIAMHRGAALKDSVLPGELLAGTLFARESCLQGLCSPGKAACRGIHSPEELSAGVTSPGRLLSQRRSGSCEIISLRNS